MSSGFLNWLSENASWGQVIQICWWSWFNEPKYKALQNWHSAGANFKYAMRFIKQGKDFNNIN